MLFINENLKTKLTVKEDDQGGLLFDLHEVASNLGYDRPATAIQDFFRRNGDLLPDYATCAADNKYYVEGVIHLFLLKSTMPRAREYQKWVAFEVLPTIRKVGLKAVKELELTRALHTREITTKDQALELYEEEVVESVLASGDYYRVEGFMVPSDLADKLNLSLAGFYKCLIAAQILSESGELLKPELGRLCTKYHNSYTSSGKWYSWKPEVLDLISTTPRVTPPQVSTRDFSDGEEDLDLNI